MSEPEVPAKRPRMRPAFAASLLGDNSAYAKQAAMLQALAAQQKAEQERTQEAIARMGAAPSAAERGVRAQRENLQQLEQLTDVMSSFADFAKASAEEAAAEATRMRRIMWAGLAVGFLTLLAAIAAVVVPLVTT